MRNISSNTCAVSVVLPYYNAEASIERAVQSILRQSFKDLELILVNNNSTDNSSEIVKSINDSRILHLSESRQGVVYACNKGFFTARGRYLARMDADDYAHPQKYEKQFEYLEKHPETGVVSCLVDFKCSSFNATGFEQYVAWSNSIKSSTEIYNKRFVEMPIINPTVLFRRELIEQYGSYCNGKFPEDYDLWLRLMSKGVKFAKIPEILFSWYDSEHRLTRSDSRYSSDSFYKTKAHYLALHLEEIAKTKKIAVWGGGKLSRQRVAFLQNKGIEIECFYDLKTNRQSNIPYRHYTEIPPVGNSFILSYVGNRGARVQICAYLEAKSYLEGIDFLLVA